MTSLREHADRLRSQLRQNPKDRIGWHNLAAAEGNLARPLEAEAAARQAIALGLAAPETRLVLARALQMQGRLDEAESMFDAALAQRPDYADAHRDHAQLIWMRTGDIDRALRRLDSALAPDARNAALQLVRSIVLEHADDLPRSVAAAETALAAAPDRADVLGHSAHLSLATGQPQRARDLARRAVRAGGALSARTILAEAALALGELDDAGTCIAELEAAAPNDQYVIALRATLWRLQNDPRYASLYDYAGLVSEEQLAVPAGWPSLVTFLAAVEAELGSMHRFVAHPFQQSVRAGSQLTLTENDLARPLLRALFASIEETVRRFITRIGHGSDPLRARNTLRGSFTGAWSVRLASGGSHVDHVHPHGWISSACYIALPSTLGAGDADPMGSASAQAGWLRLGRPGVTTTPKLAAERYIRPRAGHLVLFPAYMWHGVEPFEGAERRLSVAFDVVPG